MDGIFACDVTSQRSS